VYSWASMFGGPLPPVELAAVSVHFPVREIRPMRLLLISVMFFSFGASAISAQTIPGLPPTSASSLTTLRLLPSVPPTVGASSDTQSGPPQSREYVADCVQMWDSGTHMTKQEWVRTCKRVQSRLDSLKLDGLIPETNRTER
jgi:hypothetical protein